MLIVGQLKRLTHGLLIFNIIAVVLATFTGFVFFVRFLGVVRVTLGFLSTAFLFFDVCNPVTVALRISIVSLAGDILFFFGGE